MRFLHHHPLPSISLYYVFCLRFTGAFAHRNNIFIPYIKLKTDRPASYNADSPVLKSERAACRSNAAFPPFQFSSSYAPLRPSYRYRVYRVVLFSALAFLLQFPFVHHLQCSLRGHAEASGPALALWPGGNKPNDLASPTNDKQLGSSAVPHTSSSSFSLF